MQPTPFCNINCSYCYLPHRNDAVMSQATLQAVFEYLFACGWARRLTVIWHAGEPLVLPVAYYRERSTASRPAAEVDFSCAMRFRPTAC